jgi:hypothetical protein
MAHDLATKVDALTYTSLSYAERSALSRSNPARHNRLRNAHAQRLAELDDELRNARTLAERRSVTAEIRRLGGARDEGPDAA